MTKQGQIAGIKGSGMAVSKHPPITVGFKIKKDDPCKVHQFFIFFITEIVQYINISKKTVISLTGKSRLHSKNLSQPC